MRSVHLVRCLLAMAESLVLSNSWTAFWQKHAWALGMTNFTELAVYRSVLLVE